MMEATSSLDAFAREGERLRASAIGHLDAPVPTCAGWCVRDVLGHLGRVYRSVGTIVRERLSEPPTTGVPRPPDGHAVVDFFTNAHSELLDAFASTPMETPVYTWSDDHTVGFYVRRMTHETGVHRVDVQLALGSVTPFAAAIAGDGIDELYRVVLPFGLARSGSSGPEESLALVSTDAARTWVVQFIDGRLHVHSDSAADEARVVVQGSSSDLFVFAWNRGLGSAAVVKGDRHLADVWASLAP